LIDASHWLQLALGDIGEPSSALQIIEQMRERDPLYRPGFFSGVVVYNNLGYEDKAQALIDRFRSYDPSSPILLGAESMHHSYNGRAARAVPLAERARDLEPANGVTQFWLTIALLETQQLERIVAEGVGFAKVAALDVLGRREEAFEYAGELSREGILTPLFALYNRADRSQELVDYLEERWPSLSRFAEDNPHDETGYAEMAELALAYSRTGNNERFDEALLFMEHAMSKLQEQSIDNFVYMVEQAKYLTLAGNHDEAMTQLEHAVERGWRGFVPIVAVTPIFEPISDDPRFIALETAMVENINIERETLGLEPIDPPNQL
jgi:tetratricopeptide (TPR) repeat protein